MSDGPQPASEPRWFKSSYSGGNATECVEAAFVSSGVLVRDSKNGSGPRVAIPAPAWNAFTWALRRGQLEA
ncbi:DUF397 domain-containing protein [Streptomyces diastatochromogenes]|uniref:DUF397 domain-containing protein n=1 Tax=Streptomyces diastatochromogenes TaxID=42236 RepID=UPI0036473570